MPFASRRQQRAMFGGHIPGLDKSDAKEWAQDTNFKKLPERAPAEKGKPTLRSKKANGDMLQYFMDHPDKLEARKKRLAAKERAKKAAFAAVEDLLAEAFKIAALGAATVKPNNVGRLKGMMTTNAMKTPGYASATQAMNPRKNVIRAMNTAKPH